MLAGLVCAYQNGDYENELEQLCSKGGMMVWKGEFVVDARKLKDKKRVWFQARFDMMSFVWMTVW